MGLSSLGAASDGLQTCVFDLRRGQIEGQEIDKILFFYPTNCPFLTQLSVVGLCEGMITFTRIFSPDAACEVIESEKHFHVFYQAESDIWMVLGLAKNKDQEPAWRAADLKIVLREMHSLFKMFHGSLRSLLEKQPSGELARSSLHTFITDYLSDFLVGKKIQMPSFRDCLKERGTVQMLTVSREVALDVQSLLTIIGSCTGTAVCKSLILFRDLLVSTTLSPDDTAHVFTYAIMRLIPQALSSSMNSWSYLRKSTSAGNISTSSSQNATQEYQYRSRDTSPTGQAHIHQNHRPLQQDKWFRGKDGFVTTADVSTIETNGFIPLTPVLCLQQTDDWMHLCVYQHKNMTLVLLVPVSSLINGEQDIKSVKKQLLEHALEKIVTIEQKLSRGWGGENAYHVPGYRYLIVDTNRRMSRASPPSKVTTLTKDSLLTLNRIRDEVDLEKSRSQAYNDSNGLEICARARNNAWVIAKNVRGKELYMVLEKASDTLLCASDAVEKFSNRYCDGAFSVD